jgi:hypothetical protein
MTKAINGNGVRRDSSGQSREADVVRSEASRPFTISTANVDETVHGRILEVDLHGRLKKEDYEWIVPETDRIIREHGRIRILLTLHDFQGWDSEALWEDLKWNSKHLKDIERMAVVGERTWHHWMTSACKPFTNTEVRYFEAGEIEEARLWIGGD